jgi:hypothetical protein
VVDAGEGQVRRRVLISPISIGQPNWSEKILPVSLTRKQVADSPDIDTDKPVSRQQEMGYLGYYGYGSYWGGGGLWGASIYPDVLQAGYSPQRITHRQGGWSGRVSRRAASARRSAFAQQQRRHALLRACERRRLGHVQGFLVDERSWAIRYLIVNTSNWWLGHKVLIAPQWIDQIDWTECTVSIDLTRETIKHSPPYDSTKPLEREQEAGIHAHYGRTGYWPREATQAERRSGPGVP